MGFGSLFSCASDTSDARPKKIRANKNKAAGGGREAATAPSKTEVARPLSKMSNDGAAHAYDGENNSFWDIGKYKIALKRCDNGQKLADELSEMISERAKIEDNYG